MPQTNYNRDGTSDLLPVCRICHNRMARSGRALRMLRENPHVFDGWTHRGCTSGTPRVRRTIGNTNTATTQPRPATHDTATQPPQTTTSGIVAMTLDKTKANKDIDVNKYTDLFIGLELESNLSVSDAKRATHYQYTTGKNGGMVRRETVVDGVTVTTTKNLYKETDIIADIYHDPSIGAEVVTRPLRLSEFEKAGAVHKQLKDAGADFYANGQGGCHMTFLTNQHKELSNWDGIVIQNVIQFVRAFYPALIKGFGSTRSSTRPTHFRSIPNQGQMLGLETEHYTAVSVRRESGRIWAIEIRMPNGNPNFDALVREAKFYSAVIREMAKVSKFGLINFPQATWEYNKQFYNDNYSRTQSVSAMPQQIFDILKESLELVGYNDAPVSDATYTEAMTKVENALKGGA